MSLVVCSLGKAAGTTTGTTGDIIVIPSTNTKVDGTNVNNMSPKSGFADPCCSTP